MRIGVVGGGISGLTAAVAARRLGMEVTVFEQSERRAPVGTGLVLHSNGLRALHGLGLLDPLRPKLATFDRSVVELERGGVLSDYDYRSLKIPHNHIASVRRHELHDHLFEAASSEGAKILLGRRCTAATPTGSGVALRFADGAEDEFDAVVGSDGLSSTVRRTADFHYRKSGLGFAAVCGISDVPQERHLVREIWGRRGGFFGLVPLSGNRTYFYCSAPPGGLDRLLSDDFDGWVGAWDSYGPEVQRVVRSVTDWRLVHYDEIFEVRTRRWFNGRVFAIGDAAHAMAPRLGQGANCAMVDAVVLVRLLGRAGAAAPDLEAVGNRYQKLRRRSVSIIQMSSRFGDASARWSSLPGAAVRNALQRAQDLVGPIKRMDMRIAVGYNRAEDELLAPEPAARPA
ncbi:MAG: FAD-dependent monooxygenase [Actinomycetota bacterium]|nr:FAD-dependent monooxygenase [Actinomycetota bacterium]